jgi:hypothetical protein
MYLNHGTHLKRSFVTAICVSANLLYAQALPDNTISNADIRNIVREARVTPGLRGLSAPKPSVEWSLTAGLAYVDAEDGTKVNSVPIEVVAKLPDLYRLKFSSDVYTWVRSGGQKSEGIGDLKIAGQKVIPFGNDALILGASVTVPSGSEVGGSSARQGLTAVFNKQFSDQFSALIVAGTARTNATLPAGVSRLAYFSVVRGTFTLAPTLDFSADFTRSYRRGGGGSNEVSVSAGFVVVPGSIDGSVGVGRGLTSGGRDTTISADITFKL